MSNKQAYITGFSLLAVGAILLAGKGGLFDFIRATLGIFAPEANIFGEAVKRAK